MGIDTNPDAAGGEVYLDDIVDMSQVSGWTQLEITVPGPSDFTSFTADETPIIELFVTPTVPSRFEKLRAGAILVSTPSLTYYSAR